MLSEFRPEVELKLPCLESWPEPICFTVFDQSFGFEMTLKCGATGESSIWNNCTSTPKKLKFSSVISFNQSSVARCSSVNRGEIQTMVTALSPAA